LEETGGGIFLVKTGQQGETVTLELSDNGPGVREPERVFDPFYTTRPVGKGAGLGLSACYGIVQDHRGHIRCTNRLGGGTTIHIELPTAETAFAAAAAAAASPTSSTSAPTSTESNPSATAISSSNLAPTGSSVEAVPVSAESSSASPAK
ncbi:MAG TPA: ATP-binding protein, partial [Terriglobales bacterium]|nr:ATP-binding protein [Terriglobales bacterium]